MPQIKHTLFWDERRVRAVVLIKTPEGRRRPPRTVEGLRGLPKVAEGCRRPSTAHTASPLYHEYVILGGSDSNMPWAKSNTSCVHHFRCRQLLHNTIAGGSTIFLHSAQRGSARYFDGLNIRGGIRSFGYSDISVNSAPAKSFDRSSWVAQRLELSSLHLRWFQKKE